MLSFSGAYRWFGARFQKYVEARVDRRMEDMGQKMVNKAKSLAPVDTGRLKRGIVYHYHKSKHELLLVADTYYSEFQEFGTVFFAAQPYLRPAIEYGAKLWGATGVKFGMAFYHTPRLKSAVARVSTNRQFANMQANLATSRRFNHGPVGHASHYRRSYRGGPGS
jgi:HK97 gp10 family phage protein